MANKINKKSKIEPVVQKSGDGTADDVIRANIGYIPGAESVQIQIRYWDEVKAMHVKSIEVDADEIAKVFNVFMKNLCSNCRPTYRYMETAQSYQTKKEGRAGSNAYTGATGITTDEINALTNKIAEAYAKGESMEIISAYAARRQQLIDQEVNKINSLRGTKKK
jgi:hypothetical protein